MSIVVDSLALQKGGNVPLGPCSWFRSDGAWFYLTVAANDGQSAAGGNVSSVAASRPHAHVPV